MNHELPGYKQTMDKLSDPAGWDILGIIADIAMEADGPTQAVIDAMLGDLQAIEEESRPNHPTGDKSRIGISIVHAIAARYRDTRREQKP